jgi:rRNA maturation endonuclease Nob1
MPRSFSKAAPVQRLSIVCEGCERIWPLNCALTVYERQALESRPCPHCGSYTLSCNDPKELIAARDASPTWHCKSA